VELAWGIMDPIIAAWQEHGRPPLCQYEPGYWGPDESTRWMHEQSREWFDTCPVIR
jgi:glucose-6-phosphate 1-dehydrogenase